MNEDNVLWLDAPTSEVLAGYLKQHYPGAAAVEEDGKFGVAITQGKFLLIPDDWASDTRAIVRKIIENAKNGDLEAVKFLLEHSNFTFPDFKVNGD